MTRKQKVKALRGLKHDVPLVNIRRAIDALCDIPQADMARILGTSRSNITAHISGIRSNSEIQAGIAMIWGVPAEEIF